MTPRSDPSPLRLALGFAAGMTLFLAGALWLLNTAAAASSSGVTDPRIGTAPDFVLNDMDGKPVRLSDFRGKTVLVNLWASWCPPCKAEMPELVAFYRAQRQRDLVVLAIATQDEEEAARRFIRDGQLPFVMLWDPEAVVLQQLGARGLPTSYVFDRAGVLRLVWNGQLTSEILERNVAPLVAR